MPVTSSATLKRIVLLSGARVPPTLVERLTAAGEDKAAQREIGVDHAARLCDRLLSEQVPGLHFYTLNGSRATLDIYQRLDLASRVAAAAGARAAGQA
jgi:methylenetetrahydrofolate reductase (NADPH)